VPGAAPLPRGPSVLLLGSAAELLTGPGCPVCRYTAEASEAYLNWFALEGHRDAGVLNRVLASRGMCAPHTRRLVSQPGAATRLTAVFRYVLEAATRDLFARPAVCPACEHDAADEERVLDILLDHLQAGDRHAYKEHGGLCLPHLRRAAGLRKNLDLRWLTRFMIVRLSTHSPDLDLLAGRPDPDADVRAAFRAALPRRPPVSRCGTCSVCWAAADAERIRLAESGSSGGRGPDSYPQGCLCGPHLRDCALACADAPGLLACEADRQAERLRPVLAGQPRLLGLSASWLPNRARRAFADPDCPVCHGSDEAAMRETGRLRAAMRDAEPGSRVPIAMCLRHAGCLNDVDAIAGRLAGSSLTAYAGELLSELAEAFRKETWAHRAETRGAEMTAWRRAAAFLDGAVCGGCPADY
jgi:hypothetical protein